MKLIEHGMPNVLESPLLLDKLLNALIFISFS